MSLKDMKSKYDRNTYDQLEPVVGTSVPGDGTYFTDNGNLASPYNTPLTTAAGVSPQSDQMVELLNNDITTTTGHTYLKAPHTADYQDLEGINIVEDEPNRYEDQNFGP